MTIKTELYDYQREAVEKLKHKKIGALYMEMGTGKTRTALELVKNRYDAGKVNAVLWLCPCSVKQNLNYDIIYHCGEKPDWLVIKGIESIASSDRLYLKLLNFVKSYDVYLIVDESNLVKNPFAKRTMRITEMSNHCLYKLILNGTPVSRNEADMFAQWYILDWRVLGYKSYYSFAANHLVYKEIKTASGRKVTTDQVVRVLDVDYLTERIQPFSYQIKKEDCMKLPEKHHENFYFKMDAAQIDAYWNVKHEYLLGVDELKPETIYKYFTALQHVTSGRNVTSYNDERMVTKNLFDNWSDNPRLCCLLSVIRDDINGEQCIIFAKYKQEVAEIEQMLDDNGFEYAEFTGRLNQKKRQESLQKFRDGTQFLIANKMCGAYGLNLQFCRNVIFYDNDFDFATRSQAEDRVHRIGQTRDVCIYDIVASDSIDEFVTGNLRDKKNLVEEFKRYLKEQKKSQRKEVKNHDRVRENEKHGC